MDISFNPAKSHYITFGGSFSSLTRITRNNVELKRVAKLKYLGCYFHEQSCKIDFSYGSFMVMLIISCQLLVTIEMRWLH